MPARGMDGQNWKRSKTNCTWVNLKNDGPDISSSLWNCHSQCPEIILVCYFRRPWFRQWKAVALSALQIWSKPLQVGLLFTSVIHMWCLTPNMDFWRYQAKQSPHVTHVNRTLIYSPLIVADISSSALIVSSYGNLKEACLLARNCR